MMIREIALSLLILAPSAAMAQHAGPGHAAGMVHSEQVARPTEPGQGAFAAIQEIVEILIADPATDWSKVNIEALRRHLIDMSNVTLYAEVKRQPIESGETFTVTGTGPVVRSIQGMVSAHADTMNGVGGWRYVAETLSNGARLTVSGVAAGDRRKLQALGFIGVMAMGFHHQDHHLMIARGASPHR